jgi:hypothetical protein
LYHRNNNPDGFGAVPLTIPLGKGVALPGLEEGIVGMRKGEIRRIIVPSELGYSKYPGLEPVPANKLGAWAGAGASLYNILVYSYITAQHNSSVHPYFFDLCVLLCKTNKRWIAWSRTLAGTPPFSST